MSSSSSSSSSISVNISPSFHQKLAEKCSLPFAADSQEVAQRGFRDYTGLKLKPDNPNRPMWVCPDGYIYLEMFLPVSKQASDFLITMAEPMCRPELIHEYQITVFGLYAGLSVGLSVDDLLSNLNKFSKNELPEQLIATVKSNAEVFGKVKLVLRDNKHWIESSAKDELDFLTSNPVINASRKRRKPNPPGTLGAQRGGNSQEVLAGALNEVLLNDVKSERGASGGIFHDFSYAVKQEQARNPSPASSVVSGANSSVGGSAVGGGDYVTTEAPVLDTSYLAFKLTEGTETDSGVRSLSTLPSSSSSLDSSSNSNKVSTTGSVPAATKLSVSAGGTDGDSSSRSSLSSQPVGSSGSIQSSSNSSRGGQGGSGSTEVYSFEVDSAMIEDVKRVALEQMQRPLVMEYDFRKDRNNPTLDTTLRSSTNIRYYQERALRKMFSNGRARSGIIVLPCGAGKTLTGITAACTMRKSVMVLTTSAVAVDQWHKQFEEFTTINPHFIRTLTSDSKSDLWSKRDAGVLVSTYTMLAYGGKRSDAAERILDQIREREWGLLIFDEVQFAPAPAFRRVNATVRSHCKLGLTATLVREDDLIKDLQWLIGPKLYEANWLELQERGYLAKAQCSEVWCPMTKEFYREYLRCSHAKQRKLWVCNPNKMMACEFLLRYHEARGDKVIIFSDNLFALDNAARSLHKPFISGAVTMAERMTIINMFKVATPLTYTLLCGGGLVLSFPSFVCVCCALLLHS
eukprot:GHVQ01043610.1.p1 GENE.GHVQ01043610.1~~GHVQ01043610.1.p1  ORF type:complete len:743 (+),score=101.73 GHVQ01043610.1:230-2458(+)